ncbi:primosomal protein N', partial [Kingella kingae]|nr:primosomal protein N' [Kingella kingae]
MIYHHIALNTILPLLTYSHHSALANGTRVVVKLRGKEQVGIVWASDITPDIVPTKILPIERVLDNHFTLPESWQDLVAFTSRYYHYPIGQTAFTALPTLLKTPKAVKLPCETVYYALNEIGQKQPAPPKHLSLIHI